MTMHWLLAAVLMLTTAQERRPDGGVFAQPNADPRQLAAADVDVLMWPIVRRINQSGWIWTTESCQGHGTLTPLLGLVTDDPGRMFALLAEAQAEVVPNDGSESSQDPKGFSLRVYFWQRPRVKFGSVQVRLVVEHTDALRVFSAFAARVSVR